MPKPFLYLLPKAPPNHRDLMLSETVKSFDKALRDLPYPGERTPFGVKMTDMMLRCTLDALRQIIARDGDLPVTPKFEALSWRVNILEKTGGAQ